MSDLSVTEQYWRGVLDRLQAEVESFNQVIAHNGEMGHENELSLARVLERLVPNRYGVGSGLVIDSSGGVSRQLDIIIYDQADEPALLGQTTQVLYPIENVRAVIEVKTRVTKREIEDAGKKVISVRALNSATGKVPLTAFVGYSSAIEAATITQHVRALAVGTECPDLILVVELALLGAAESVMTAPPGVPYTLGIAPLQELDGQGGRLLGKYRSPPAGGMDVEVLEDGRRYPIVKADSDELIGEPSRALLLFSMGLLRSLAAQDGRRLALDSYLPAIVRDLHLLK